MLKNILNKLWIDWSFLHSCLLSGTHVLLFICAPMFRVAHIDKVYTVFLWIISSVMIRGFIMRRKISNVLTRRSQLFGSTLAQHHWMTGPLCRINNLVFWIDGSTPLPPGWWLDTLRMRPVRWRKLSQIRFESREIGQTYCVFYPCIMYV